MSTDNVQERLISDPVPLSIDDAADAILGNWKDADEDQPSEEGNLEATDETTNEETTVEDSEETEDTETEQEDETEEDPEEQEDSQEETTSEDEEQEIEEVDLSDETIVELIVDGETKQASLKDLKRLYGQEASLTESLKKLHPNVNWQTKVCNVPMRHYKLCCLAPKSVISLTKKSIC